MRWLFAPDYAAHEGFVAPARGKPEWWRLVIGLPLIVVLFFVLSSLFLALVDLGGESEGGFATGSADVFELLLALAFLIPATALVTRLLHDAAFLTLLGPMPLFFQQFGRVLMVQMALVGLLFLLSFLAFEQDAPQPNLSFDIWITLLPVALVAIVLQCAGEELLFRGYLQQQLAARAARPLFWMVLPAVLFAWGHYSPTMAGDTALALAGLTFVFALIAADLTARAGTLGPALAVHFGNNILAILFLAPASHVSGLALYTLPYALTETAELMSWLPVDLAAMCVSWLAARIILRR